MYRSLLKKLLFVFKYFIIAVILLILAILIFKQPLSNLIRKQLSLSDGSLITYHTSTISAITHTPDKCIKTEEATVSDLNSNNRIAVWNIYKQQIASWETDLKKLMQENSIILLQEAKLDLSLKNLVKTEKWNFYQIEAFKLGNDSYGVALLTKTATPTICGYLSDEPWIIFPKSVMKAQIELTNAQTLTIVNIHSINFSIGLIEYQKQLETLLKKLPKNGPMIIAGDFNTWRSERMQLVQNLFKAFGLKEVIFNPDERTRAMNNPLDHIFYREITIGRSAVILNKSSDHMAMEITVEAISEPSINRSISQNKTADNRSQKYDSEIDNPSNIIK